MRDSCTLVLLVMPGLAAQVVACAPSQVGAAARGLRPSPTTAAAASGESTCSDVADTAQPLAVDWKAHERADLEVAMRNGVAVVRYDCQGLEVLRDCRVPGSYGFLAISPKQESVQLVDADEIRVNLPAAGIGLLAELTGELRRGAALDLATMMVGISRTTVKTASREQLQGSCDGATHIVRGAYLGAFRMRAGQRGQAQTSAHLFGLGAGAGSTSTRFAGSSDGDPTVCAHTALGAVSPPPACSAVVRLELARVAPLGRPRPAGDAGARGGSHGDAIPGCGSGLVLGAGKCAKPGRVSAYQCTYGDARTCTEQCELGHAGSCGALGRMYFWGDHVARDGARALQIILRTCEAGLAQACADMGAAYSQGQGVAKDSARAVEFFRRACDSGDAEGCSGLAFMYATGAGVTADAARAVQLFQRGCDAGFAQACSNLGSMYVRGEGGPKNAQVAVQLFQRACDAEFGDACFNLGVAYSQGDGTAKDSARAAQLYQRACNAGAMSGCFNLGVAYSQGEGVGRDSERAAQLFQRACDAGDTDACKRAQRLRGGR